MKPIIVVDAFCGAGKTSWAIQHMTSSPGPFLFVTPYLDEIRRVKKACPGFTEPTAEGSTKSDNLKTLLVEGKSIATTHELFKRMDAEAVNLVQAGGYSLILDEVVEVISPLYYPRDEVRDMLDSGILRKNEETSRGIATVAPGARENLNRYADLRAWAAEERLVLVDEGLLMWIFPAGVFGAFKEVFNLCYLFEGSYQKAYYDMHGLTYEMASVGKGASGRWILDEYLPADQEEPIKARLRPLIEVVYDDRLNLIGEADTALSRNWFKKQPYAVRKLSRAMHNFFRNLTRSTAKQRLWTCPKSHKDIMAGDDNRYARSFISSNTRATNEYKERSIVAYCLNVFIKPEVDRFFKDRGVVLDQELYALSEMVQLIWRSRIRDGKSIVVFIPSKRMRDLFDGWLNGSLMEDAEEGLLIASA